jgi:hypothetical protein
MLTKSLAAAVLALVAGGAFAANPTASINAGYSFTDWLTVNNVAVGDGLVDDSSTLYFLKEKQIGNLQSWLVFFDPYGRQSVDGSVTFDQPIVSLFTTTADVNTTSVAYRLTPTVTYQDNYQTGLETNRDSASFSGNVLSLNWTASDPGDHVRVLTAVPEPSTYALMAIGMGWLLLGARRRAVA